MIKKLDWLVIKSYIGPFILTFCIAQFVLVMMFLWTYIDDLVGKGLSLWVLIQLLTYASARLVPMALPLAVLLAGIMTYGSFGEHFELTAAKAAGISLLRFMRPLVFTVTGISIFAFYFSNNLLPLANLKFTTLLYDIRHQKPTLAIKPGIFYSGIDGYFIKVLDKDEKTNTLYNMTVYDHTSGHGNDHVITAKQGSMTQDDDAMALTLKLENGREYREVDPKEPKDQASNTHEMINTNFKSWEKRFDLSQFKLNHTDESFFKDMQKMMNLHQLLTELDSIKKDQLAMKTTMVGYAKPYFNLKKYGLDTLKTAPTVAALNFTDIKAPVGDFEKTKRLQIMELAMTKARNIKNYAEIAARQLEFKGRDYAQHMIEIYRKFTLSIACLVLFFIGAPLGSIIRRGGLGWPLFYSVIFFIVYHVTSIFGEKLAESGMLSTFTGMWLSTFVLTPMGMFLTLKASNDSKIYSTDYYTNLIRRILPAKAKTA